MAIIERILIAMTEVVAILVTASARMNRRLVTHPVTTAPLAGAALFAVWTLGSWAAGEPAWVVAGALAAGLTIILWARTAHLVSVDRRRRQNRPA